MLKPLIGLLLAVGLAAGNSAFAQDAAKQNGVLLFAYRTHAHVRISKLEEFKGIVDDLTSFLKSNGVPVVNDLINQSVLTEETTSTDTLVTYLRQLGAQRLLLLAVDRPIAASLKLILRCYDPEGKLLWEETIKETTFHEHTAVAQATEELHERLGYRVQGLRDNPTPFTVAPPAAVAPDSAVPVPPETKPRVFLQAQSKGSNQDAARDQSMEMSKDFEEVCPSVRITINQQMADYTVSLNHIEVGWVRDNQFQVADRNGDLISKTKEGGSIKAGVKRLCYLIAADWSKNKGQTPAAGAETPAPAQAVTAQPTDAAPTTELTIISTPDGADIELDGAFVGTTPSTVALANGDHTVRVSKKGYQLYEKKLRTSGGSVSLRAGLEVAQ